MPETVAMMVQVHILNRDDEVSATLLHDGWQLETPTPGELLARHHAAIDESSARHRLDKVGLLTSSNVRIEFHHPWPESSRPSRRA